MLCLAWAFPGMTYKSLIKKMNEELINGLRQDLAIELPVKISMEELETRLAEQINELINQNFSRLVQLLYRADISEPRLKKLLKENAGENAGLLIARLLIERQLQKIKTRQAFKQNNRDISEEEKW